MNGSLRICLCFAASSDSTTLVQLRIHVSYSCVARRMSIVFVFSGWPTVKLQQISTKNHARPITDDDEGEKSSCRQLLPTPTWLLATGLAYHLQARDLQMPVLTVVLLDAGVGCSCLRVFF